MENQIIIKGRCLCSKVQLSLSVEEKTFDVCHCSMCRRWSGGPALAVHAKNGVQFQNEQDVKIYSSSDWAERGFCQHCGTHLFYRLKNGQFINVPLGILDDQSGFQFTTQIYVDNKPACYSFSNETKMMTEADVLKTFGVSE